MSGDIPSWPDLFFAPLPLPRIDHSSNGARPPSRPRKAAPRVLQNIYGDFPMQESPPVVALFLLSLAALPGDPLRLLQVAFGLLVVGRSYICTVSPHTSNPGSVEAIHLPPQDAHHL